jgi:hypothetical protein
VTSDQLGESRSTRRDAVILAVVDCQPECRSAIDDVRAADRLDPGGGSPPRVIDQGIAARGETVGDEDNSRPRGGVPWRVCD